MSRRPVTTLPKIVQFLGTRDSGEYGATNCAHCGAKGRYEHDFLCEDGVTRSAMAGCIQLFPVSPVADEQKKIDQRRIEREKDGQKLASWDVAKLEAIEAFYAGTITEDDCLLQIKVQNSKRQQWLDRRYGGRRRR